MMPMMMMRLLLLRQPAPIPPQHFHFQTPVHQISLVPAPENAGKAVNNDAPTKCQAWKGMFKLCCATGSLQNGLMGAFTPSALSSGGLGKACAMSLPLNVCALPLYSFSLRCRIVRSSPSPDSAVQVTHHALPQPRSLNHKATTREIFKRG